jgi:hypothetical protein
MVRSSSCAIHPRRTGDRLPPVDRVGVAEPQHEDPLGSGVVHAGGQHRVALGRRRTRPGPGPPPRPTGRSRPRDPARTRRLMTTVTGSSDPRSSCAAAPTARSRRAAPRPGAPAGHGRSRAAAGARPHDARSRHRAHRPVTTSSTSRGSKPCPWSEVVADLRDERPDVVVDLAAHLADEVEVLVGVGELPPARVGVPEPARPGEPELLEQRQRPVDRRGVRTATGRRRPGRRPVRRSGARRPCVSTSQTARRGRVTR